MIKATKCSIIYTNIKRICIEANLVTNKVRKERKLQESNRAFDSFFYLLVQ